MWHFVAASQLDAAKWIIVSCAAILLLVIVGGVGVWYYRKWVLFSDPFSDAVTWTFEDLRLMRDRGDLTEEEYQSLRASMVGSFQGKPKGVPPGQGVSSASETPQRREGDEDHESGF